MKVIIIYNPNSTGDSEANAKQLAMELKKASITVETKKTTHAGHGEEIARDLARKDSPVILISSSGDGGYHEVINGALSVDNSNLVVGVLASGNANDHATALGSDSIAKAIKSKKFTNIDTIKISATVDGKTWERYAHSYAGIGVAANAAKRLTEDRPNSITEKWIVARSLLSFHYVKIKENDAFHKYSSIIFGNIDKMSKVLQLSDKSSVTDGKFEMTRIRFRSKLRLIIYLITAATVGLKRTPSLKEYIFETVKKTPLQMDGEVYVIDERSRVTVESVKQNLRCIL
jgi:diacylglycerol kinase (ATP)